MHTSNTSHTTLSYDTAIIGGGLAGITVALELLNSGQKVVIIDRDTKENFGGLAKNAFGGMLLVNTPIQRVNLIRDTPEIALRDWLSFANFSAEDSWPRRWAELYVNRSVDDIYCWIVAKKIKFIPVPHWVERGEFGDGNSLPRYHIVWGTGDHLMNTLIAELQHHPNAHNLTTLFEHKVESLICQRQCVSGVQGIIESSGADFKINAENIVVASGGINGDIQRVRREWDETWGTAPPHILNGSHRYADGTLHDAVEKIQGNVTHLHQMWNYAAGIHHPKPTIENQGLSLIPPKSALWLDATGKRFSPLPLITGFDTHMLCKRIAQTPQGYSWQVMNWKIALQEMAISGAQHNPSIKDRRLIHFTRDILCGNKNLLDFLVNECEDVLVAHSIEELVEKMNALNAHSTSPVRGHVNLESVQQAIQEYDAQLSRGKELHNDDQLRRIAQVRQWRGDRARTCRFQKIIDPKAMPLIAIREFIVSRKSMGGIQTDLQSRVLSTEGLIIPGLYAVGEAAGFGGGGISGLKSLEGTFLSNCILNGRMAARSITHQALLP